MSESLFTSESVCAGHPDKVCDQISDSILDAILEDDPTGRVAVETAVTKDRIILLGEVTTTAQVDYKEIAREVARKLGYTDPAWGFSDLSEVQMYLSTQSPEIAAGVDLDGAGDQGMMFGYACRETPELMPLPITLAHALTRALDEAAISTLPYLRPDGKAQVTVRYQDGQPVGVEHVTIAKPHSPKVELDQVKRDIIKHVVIPVLAKYDFSIDPSKVVVNGTGVWHTPGPSMDAGLTGRKIIVDSYGGYARVGGGAFSGKDPTKVDRSGAYAARYIAKNIVAAGLADRAEVSLAYFIGAKQPVMKHIETFSTSAVSDLKLSNFTNELIDTSVKGIVETLDLRRPIFARTAAYGHFGQPGYSWEQTIRVPAAVSTN